MNIRFRKLPARALITFGVALLLSLAASPTRAQPTRLLSDDELYEGARQARAQSPPDFLAAATFIYAYIQRNNAEMRDADHRNRVLEFYEAARGEATLRPGSRGTLANLPTLPPKSGTVSTQGGHPLVCRGGGDMHFTYESSGKAQIRIMFNRASFGVGPRRENMDRLPPGHCAWLDRGISQQEPNVLVLAEPLYDGRISLQWQHGRLTGLSSELDYINRLLREDALQAFRAYNDGRGSFVVTRVE